MHPTSTRSPLTLIESLVNLAIESVPEALPLLESLEGRTLEIILTPFKTPVFVSFEAQRITLSWNLAEKATSRVEGSISAFMASALSGQSSLPKSLRIEGDANDMMTVHQLIQVLKLDWEEILSQFTGDAPAYFIGKNIKRFGHWWQDNFQTFKENTHDFVIDEIPLVPHANELTAFFDDVDRLRHQVERFEKRLGIIEHDL